MGRQKGFTIIEATLFITLSSLLAVLVLAGMNGALQNNRVTDTTRSLESFMELQLADVRAGTVLQTTNAGGMLTCGGAQAYPGKSNECIVLGKVLKLSGGTTSRVSAYNVVANVEPSDTCAAAATGVDGMKQYCPTVLAMQSPVESYQPEWGARLSKIAFRNFDETTSTTPNAIAFLRDPMSELVYTVVFNTALTTGELDLRPLILPAYTNTEGAVCLTHDGFPAMTTFIHFTGGEGSAAIETNSDANALPTELRC